ncbi:TIM barrel protein [Tabrizicola sp. J26]|uniref:TIM barrel protein n=1 Tax=Alitabrizicola rongguiensis TaxID=2909234 RepID=UPI001F175816|nr:TIM barrel protein [Tabrizicola rongguiensis]MCF1707959.1 TIM barrel protein [Tabrizicola rongguiensis]
MQPFALNHMTTPRMGWQAFADLASALGCVGVEYRNDLGRPLFEGDDPAAVGAALRQRGLRFLALAEVKMFNDWSDAKRAEAQALMRVAVAAGAEAVSLIPRNDGIATGKTERMSALRLALTELLPLLRANGLRAMVEPLGFEVCSLRFKADVVDVIEALGATDTYKLVHDTFHHHLAGGGPIFPQHTGIVHVSGVVDRGLSVSEMRDGHRVLVDADDRLGNIAQIRALQSAGYSGPISFEPFAASVHELRDPAAALRTSMEFIDRSVAAAKV